MFAIAEPIPYGKDALPACDQNFRGPVKATGLRSLEQLLDINVEHYVLIGEAFSRIDRVFDGGIFSSMKIPPDRVDFLRNLLPGLATHCQALELQVTRNLISDFRERYASDNPTWEQALVFLKCIRATFKSELGTRVFLNIHPERTRYYAIRFGGPDRLCCGSEIAELLEVLESFPRAKYDALEAGQCLACERFTAAVYHLMRVAEFGLVSMADSLPVTVSSPSWEGIITAVNRELKIRAVAPVKPTGWRDQEKVYREMLSWLGDIKTGWRNPVSHVPRMYLESQAKGIFSATKNLMAHLAKNGIPEVVNMPACISIP